MRILIVVPTYETISPDTFKSIYGLDRGDHHCFFDFVRGYDCAAARNRIAQKAIEEQMDYVLMVDNDIVLKEDALIYLLDEEKEVSLGYCPRRNNDNVYDGRTCIYRMGEFSYTWQYPAIELKELRNKGIYKVQVHGGGLACALIKTEVFQKIEYPWFYWVNYQDREFLSEDLYFCEQCNKAGIPIYVDTRADCGHLLRHIQWPT